jgi:arginine exporter protein ArgO
MLAYLIQGIGYGFAAAAQPGPFQTYLISQTLSKGWRLTLPAALAPLISDGPIIVLALVVLSQVPLWFQRFLYIAGGLFILYLAYSAFVAWRNYDKSGVVTDSSGRQSVVKAAMMVALSPGPYIYWSLVTGPILLTGWREAHCYVRHGKAAWAEGKSGVAWSVSYHLSLLWIVSVVAWRSGRAHRLSIISVMGTSPHSFPITRSPFSRKLPAIFFNTSI